VEFATQIGKHREGAAKMAIVPVPVRSGCVCLVSKTHLGTGIHCGPVLSIANWISGLL
jgi:hypothetical protein